MSYVCMHVPPAKPVINRIKELRLHKDDFESLKIIGTGAFGEVRLIARICM